MDPHVPEEANELLPVGKQTHFKDQHGSVEQGKDDCCLTAIRFAAVYPGNMTVKLTAANGQVVTRTFTASKKVRTAFLAKKGGGDDDDDSNETGILVGGMGPCVDVDVSLADTASPTLAIVHYHFRICCKDKHIHPGTVLTEVPKAKPNEHVTTLPLLRITGIRIDHCP